MVKQRAVKKESNILLVDQLGYNTYFRILFLNDVVFENGFSIKQIFLIIICNFLNFCTFPVFLLRVFLCHSHIWSEDNDLFSMHDIYSVIRLFLERTSLDKIDLLVLRELRPLFCCWQLIMQDDYGREVFTMLSS